MISLKLPKFVINAKFPFCCHDIKLALRFSSDLLRHFLIALLSGAELRTLTPSLFSFRLFSRVCP
jgi:hypothetical protein